MNNSVFGKTMENLRERIYIYIYIENLCSLAVEHSTCIQHSHGKAAASLFKQEHPNTIQTKFQIAINGKN